MKTSRFPSAALLAVGAAILGTILIANGIDTDLLTGETSTNPAYYIGLIVLAVATISAQYAIAGFAARQALIEHREVQGRDY